MEKKSNTGMIIWGVAFVWFTTHFGGGFASGAQIYSYYVVSIHAGCSDGLQRGVFRL